VSSKIDLAELDAALRRCGSTWNAAQSHGLICSRLAIQGGNALEPWLNQVLENTDTQDSLRRECTEMLQALHDISWRQLAERSSDFQLLMPDDSESVAVRTEALAQWCEGFLHGLVVRVEGDSLKARLAAEPLRDIIKDVLEISRAEVGDDDDESNEIAYAELLEYLRVAVQLVYEELAECRQPRAPLATSRSSHHVH
jgi:uncharacterized protein YgfB (UPF0149 family)